MGDTIFQDLLRRFHNFDDGILRAVEVRFYTPAGKPEARITISVRDTQGGRGGGDSWANVVLELAELAEFRLTDGPRNYNRVLSSGLSLTTFDGLVFLIINDDPPRDVSEARQSEFYLAATTCRWTVGPYAE
jgi:hypothetical protein